MNGQQLLREPELQPTPENISTALGAADGAYNEFVGKLGEHGISANWRYYNYGKAWLCKGVYKWTTTRGTPKETTAFWLSIWDGFFAVTIYIPEKHRHEALTLPLGAEIHKMVEEGKQMGKLKFFPVTFRLKSAEPFDDVFTLIDFRKLLK